MACYSIGDLSRRDLMKMSAAIAGANAFFPIDVVVAAALQPTPRQVLGPFYPRTSLARTSDLTHVPGRTGRAAGLVLDVMGRVLNISGEPVANAKLDVWQANSYGRYTNRSDDNPGRSIRISRAPRRWKAMPRAVIDSSRSSRPPTPTATRCGRRISISR